VIAVVSYAAKAETVGAIRTKFILNELSKRSLPFVLYSKDSVGDRPNENELLWALGILRKIASNRDITTVYLSCGPFLASPMFGLFCRARRKRLIVDFRDPWSGNIRYQYHKNVEKWTLKLQISILLEKLVYACSSDFVVCTPGMHAYYAKLFKSTEKLLLAENGYSLENPGKESYNEDSTIKMVCLGGFAECGIELALRALEKLDCAARNAGKPVVAYFIGTDRETELLLADRTYNFKCVVMGRMPYQEAMEFARNCDVGIALLRNEQFEFGTKIFDYIGLGLWVFDLFSESFEYRSHFSRFLVSDLRKKSHHEPAEIEPYSRSSSMKALMRVIFSSIGGGVNENRDPRRC